MTFHTSSSYINKGTTFHNMKYILPALRLKTSAKISCAAAVLVVYFVGLWIVVPVQAATGINDTINFQGKLVDEDGLNVADSTYSVVFSLYTVDENGTAIWTETQSVTTTDGLFQVHLGSITDLPGSVDFNTDNLYLGIKVGADTEMTPRIRFAAVPYAFNAQKVAGLTVTDTTGTLTIPNGKTIQFGDAFSTTGANSLNLTTTGTTSLTLPTTGTLLTNTAASNQTITSTQTLGTILGLTDTTNITGATTGLAVTLSGTGAFDQTGLAFNLSGASGTNLNDIVGTGNSWKVSRTGDLTVNSCTGCGGSGFSAGYFRLNDGALSPINDTTDLLVGGNASSSAKFKVSPSGTSPTASVSGKTAQAALMVDNQGTGDIFTASASGLNRFVIKNNGDVGIGTTAPVSSLHVVNTSSGQSTQGLTLQNGASAAETGVNINFILSSSTDNSMARIGALRTNDPLSLATILSFATHDGASLKEHMRISATGKVGIGPDFPTGTSESTYPNATLDVRASSGTLPIASYSGSTSRAGFIVDNNGVGDLFTASKSGASKFSILNNGNLRLNNYLSCTALETDSSGNLTCGADDTGGGSGGVNYLRLSDGSFSLVNDTTDFLFGGNASSSAKFKLSPSGTSPTASVSGRTAQAALIVDNQGTGDLFAASASGLNRFVIKSNGNVGIGTTTPDAKLDITGAVTDGALTYKNSQVNFTRTSTTGFSYKDYGSYVSLSDASNGNGTDGDTRDSYGYYATVSHTGTGSSGFTKNIYGGRFSGTATGSIDAASSSTAYGVYATAVGTTTGAGTSQAIGLYSSATGGDNNFAAIFANGSVRIDSLLNCTGLSTSASGVITCGGGGGSGTNYLRLTNGAFSLVNDTTDFLFGSNASSSAKFKISPSGTSPTASVSGSTAQAALMVDNTGNGDLFTASKSGKTQFVINNAGNVGIGTSNADNRLVVGSDTATDEAISVKSRNYAGIYLNADTDNDGSEIGQPFIKFAQDNDTVRAYMGLIQNNNVDPLSNALTGAFADGYVLSTTNTLQLATNNALRMTVDSTGKIGVGTNSPQATLDVRAQSGTLPVASFSGTTSKAAMIVDNNGVGDLLTASKSGASKFTVMNNGNVRINNLNASNCDVKSDTTGQLFCGTDSTSGTSKFVVKGVDETVSAIALQNDDDLFFTAGASETWIIDYHLLVSNANSITPDFRIGILGAAGWTCRMSLTILVGTTIDGKATGTDCDNAPTIVSDTSVVADGGNDMVIKYQGIVTTTGTAGTIQLQWSPNTSANLTVRGGSYVTAQRVGGADLAEVYYTTDESIEPGDVVSMDSSIAAGVKKSSKAYDSQAYGIVSTKPGLVLGDGETNTQDKPVMVALSGRVPVKVSTSNGEIKAGDLLTSSSIPGVAMKATKAGQVIGQAMTGYAGDEVGTIAAFIKTDYAHGAKLSDIINAEGQSVDTGKAAIEHFIKQKSQTKKAVDVSELLTDRVTAEREVIAPRVVADKVEVNTITASTGKNVAIELSDDGQFILKNASGEAVVKFDSKGNAVFSGTVKAGKFELASDSGLAMLESKALEQDARITSLESKVATSSSSSTIVSVTSSSSAETSQSIKTDSLSVAGAATVSANLRVQGNSLIEGILSVVDTLTVSNIIVNKVANFFADVIFHSDVFFKGTAYFNEDAAGYITVKKGLDKAEVKFTKSYDKEPVVNASVVTTKIDEDTFKKFIEEGICDKEAAKATCEEKVTQKAIADAMPFVIASRSTDGFTILLSQPAAQDLTFSWSALAVIQAEEISLKGGDK